MTTLHVANAANAESSMNYHLKAKLALITLPAVLPTLPAFKFNWEDIAASLPCFAVTHLSQNTPGLYQGFAVGGTTRGQRRNGLMEVSCFVNKTNVNWQAQLRTMRAMVDHFVLYNVAVPMLDFTNPDSPASTGYKIDLYGVEEVPVQADPNPNIVRARTLIRYGYVARA